MLGSFVLSSGYYDILYAQKVRHLIKMNIHKIFKECRFDFISSCSTTAPAFGSFKTSLEMYLSDIYTISVNLQDFQQFHYQLIKMKMECQLVFNFIAKHMMNKLYLMVLYL